MTVSIAGNRTQDMRLHALTSSIDLAASRNGALRVFRPIRASVLQVEYYDCSHVTSARGTEATSRWV
jgi:hypothetical protein